VFAELWLQSVLCHIGCLELSKNDRGPRGFFQSLILRKDVPCAYKAEHGRPFPTRLLSAECKKPVFVAPTSVGKHSNIRPNPPLSCAYRKYIPCVYVVNKVDQITLEELEVMDRMPHYCPVSAHLEWNLDGLLDKIWEYLNLIRVSVLPPCRNPVLFPHIRCGLS
jgi:hypothetical protein